MPGWQRNLILVWLSQFLGLMAFSLGMPFAVFMMQHDLGITDSQALKFWNGLFVAAPTIPLAIMSPIWGRLGDRYGRRKMMLRANLSGLIVLPLMGCVPNVESLIALRLVQGVFTGTISAAVTLVATDTPEHRHGFALGALNAGIFGGSFAGAAVGGVLAEWVGYRVPFFIAGGMMALSVLLVAMVRENFVPPTIGDGASGGGADDHRRAWRPVLPLLLVIGALSFVRMLDQPILPLLVQHINGGLEGAARVAGLLNGVASIGAMVSGPLLGWAADRWRPALVGKWCLVVAAVFALMHGLVSSFGLMFPARFLLTLSGSGLDPVLQTMLSRQTPSARRGQVFGFAATARCGGWLFAPLLAVGVAAGAEASGVTDAGGSLRVVYVVNALCYLALIPALVLMARRLPPVPAAPPPEDDEGPPINP